MTLEELQWRNAEVHAELFDLREARLRRERERQVPRDGDVLGAAVVCAMLGAFVALCAWALTWSWP